MADQADTGRGLALITLAKLYFIVMGFLVQLGLPRLLSPEAFGQYSLAMSFVSIVNNVLIAATVQSVSKRVSETPELAAGRLRQGLQIQLAVGLMLTSTLTLVAPWIAGAGYDEELTPLLRVTALVPLFYAVYAALVGNLNGRQLFKRQALLDMTFSTLRTVGILGAALLGFGALGSVAGFTGAAFIILVIALLVVGIGARGPTLPVSTWFAFLLPVVLFQGALNGMLLLDVWVLKITASELGLAAGMARELASEQASTLVGFYKAGQNFALVPYQVILSVTFVVFPLVSRAVAEGDHEAARGHIRNALRFSILVLFALAAPLGGGAEALVRLAFPKFLAAADVLGVLVFGQIALALFVIIATILSGAGRPAITVVIATLGLGVVLAANRLLVQSVGLGDKTLATAALSTSLGTTVALVASAFVLKRLLGVGLPMVTLLRAALAAGGALYVARVMPQSSGLMAPVVMLAAGVVYVSLLLASRELTKADFDAVLAVVRKKKPT